jgi:hypothetical protein
MATNEEPPRSRAHEALADATAAPAARPPLNSSTTQWDRADADPAPQTSQKVGQAPGQRKSPLTQQRNDPLTPTRPLTAKTGASP